MSGNEQISNFFSYFVFILDKFRLKFHELFSSCCCCCKTVARTMVPFKSSGIIQHSPISINTNRSSLKFKHKRNSTTSGGGQIMANMAKHTGINMYTHNGPISPRLTNV